MPSHKVIVEDLGGTIECRDREGLFQSLSRLSRKRIPSGCTNGGCGLCKIRITDGTVSSLGRMSRAHISEDEEAAGYVLGCRVTPQSTVRIRLDRRLRKFLAG
jgi:3-phenylpropionate/trans-cinnamate dioxygenase ferredoxin reductase subunit